MAPELKRELDYSDYEATPDDGNRYEILRGDLYVTPAPTPYHQRASKRLQRQLESYFEERSLGEVFNAPIGLILTERDIAQPDLLVVADAGQISRRGIEGPPLLVVEVLSPSTRKRDQGVKAERYAELGVQHFWIVDPDHKRLECHRLAGRRYQLRAEAQGGDTLVHPDFDELTVDLSLLWSQCRH